MTDREFLESKVGGKLRRLRWNLRRRLAGEGVSWLAISLVCVVFVTLGLDFLLHLDRPVRGVIMGMLLVGVGWIVWRQLIAPLLVPMDIEQLALLVEERYGALGDCLISALQFTRSDAEITPGQSQAMVRLVIARAGEMAGSLDFQDVVEKSLLIKRMLLALCAVGLLAGFSFFQAGIMNRWWNRNVLFADTAWPQNIYLHVRGPGMDEDGNFRVLRGNDLEISVIAQPGNETMPQAPPETITLYAKYESVGWTTEGGIKVDTKGSREYTKVFRGVSEPFEFYFIGGDDKRGIRHRVSLIDPPGIGWLQFTVEYPAYMNRPSRKFDESRAVLAAPPGSLITVRATADKPVEFKGAATGMFLDGRRVGSLEIDTASKPAGAPLEAPARFIGAFRLKKSESSKKGEDKNPMRTLTISLQDTDGFENPRAAQYKIRTEPDIAPRLSLKRRGVGSAVTPEAILPLVIQAKDDSGLSEIRAVLLWGGAKPGRKSWVVQPGPDRKDRFNTLYELDIKDLKLLPGMTIRVTVEADDLMPVELNGPNKGTSGAMSFRIVKRDELLAEMVRRQKALRANFEQTIRKQEDSIATTEAMMTMLDSGLARTDAARRLRDATSMEIGVGGDCVKTSVAMGDILIEMVYNRIIEAKGRAETLNGIVTPLAELAERVDVLTAQMKVAEGTADRGNLLKLANDIRTEQLSILEVMRKVLERMIKVAEAQELAYKLERLIERWDGVMRAADNRADWDIQNALGFKCAECTKPLGPDGGPGAKVKCPHCKKAVAKPSLDRSDSD
ncbi:MAG: hypothetical protein QGH60_02750 [Phycisphaerae bacterium]|jgi:hypothetical protein|nr:hypothetical protein [Phycisphaerae bacterium]